MAGVSYFMPHKFPREPNSKARHPVISAASGLSPV